MTRRLRIVALCGALLVLLGATVVDVRPATAATISTCADITMIAARGSGENDKNTVPDYSGSDYGAGHVLAALYRGLTARAAQGEVTTSLEAVHYPAVPIGQNSDTNGFVGAVQAVNGLTAVLHVGVIYSESLALGALDTAKRVNEVVKTCPSTRIVLAGYSQGAQAIGQGLTLLDKSALSHVAATVVFGDPRFDPNDSIDYQGDFQGDHAGLFGPRLNWFFALGTSPVLSVCHAYDPICNGDSRAFDDLGWVRDYAGLYFHVTAGGKPFSLDALFAPHVSYCPDGAKACPEVDNAVKWLADQLDLPLPHADRPPADTVFVIDSTGSMRDEITAVKDNVTTLADTLAKTSTSYRFALVDFKDVASEGSAYTARVDVPFTTDETAFHDAVESIRVEGGGDTPETQYAGILAAIGLQWRPGVRKSIVVITDAPAKDPEPESGTTLDDVTRAALNLDPAQIYGVSVSSADSDTTRDLHRLADANGGAVTLTDAGDGFLKSLLTTLNRSGTAPTAGLTVGSTAVAGQKTAFSAASTVADPRDPIDHFEWNYGESGEAVGYDEVTSRAVIDHTYRAPGDYSAVVRAVTKSGLSGLATIPVHVVAAASAVPRTPTGVGAKAGDQEVVVSFGRVAGATAYRVIDGAGTTVGGFTDGGTVGAVSAVIDGLKNGTAVTYRVEAMNSAGAGSPSAAVTVTPALGPRMSVAGSVVHAGDPAHIVGTRFPNGSVVRFALISGTHRYDLGRAMPDATGRVTLDAQVPLDVPLGTALLSATTLATTVAQPTATTTVRVRTHVPTLIEAAWPFAAGLLVLLIVVAFAAISIRRRRRRRRAAGGTT